MNKNWKNNEFLFEKQKPCRHCLTSRGIRKIKEAFSRGVNKIRNAWSESKKNKNS